MNKFEILFKHYKQDYYAYILKKRNEYYENIPVKQTTALNTHDLSFANFFNLVQDFNYIESAYKKSIIFLEKDILSSYKNRITNRQFKKIKGLVKKSVDGFRDTIEYAHLNNRDYLIYFANEEILKSEVLRMNKNYINEYLSDILDIYITEVTRLVESHNVKFESFFEKNKPYIWDLINSLFIGVLFLIVTKDLLKSILNSIWNFFFK